MFSREPTWTSSTDYRRMVGQLFSCLTQCPSWLHCRFLTAQRPICVLYIYPTSCCTTCLSLYSMLQYTDILIVHIFFQCLVCCPVIFFTHFCWPPISFFCLSFCFSVAEILEVNYFGCGPVFCWIFADGRNHNNHDGWLDIQISPGFHASHLVARPTEEDLFLDYST